MQVKPGRIFIGRLEKGSDLLASLTELCQRENIRLGVFTLLGSVSSVAVAYYNQVTHKYVENLHNDARWEIVSCSGNISLKDSGAFVHAHIIFSDDKGNCLGGHLLPQTVVFAAEYHIQELSGEELGRQYDSATGLSLW